MTSLFTYDAAALIGAVREAAERQAAQPFFVHMPAIATVAGEVLIATVPGQRDGDTLSRKLADPVGR